MPPVSLLIKPASSNCNMRCSYCFYHSLAESRPTASYGVMNTDVRELLVQRALEYADKTCTFAFQGGEPTLAGLEFYRDFIELVEKYNTRKVKVHYALQTNGLAIDDEWASFLAGRQFLVGLSLDGPKDIHDAMRTDAGGRGTFNRVMNAVALLNRHRVDYNILCVVNSYTARHIGKVYDFFKRNDFRYLQFIPCLDPLEERPGGHEYSLTPERFAFSMKRLFDEWYNDLRNERRISIRYFDNLAGMLLGYPPESCGMSGRCSAHFVVEADGSVYPCDFYVFDDWRLGNIQTSNFTELAQSGKAADFIGSSLYADPQCRECPWSNICRGGCRRNREPFAEGRPVLNYYCRAYREFFDYAGERLFKASRLL